ncbi:MAG: hypothetical protein AAF944_02235 [Bacteroidota bacterium]
MITTRLKKLVIGKEKFSSVNYWEHRYATGGNSGAGSYGEQAIAKADIINQFVEKNSIESVIELGCGDGNQLTLANYPQYIGLDVSRTAITMCYSKFSTDTDKSFFYYEPQFFHDNLGVFNADLVLSLEVIFHIIEDDLYSLYLNHLVRMSKKYILVFGTNEDRSVHLDKTGAAQQHLKHRKFSEDILGLNKNIELMRVIDNPYSRKRDSKFFVFQKKN